MSQMWRADFRNVKSGKEYPGQCYECMDGENLYGFMERHNWGQSYTLTNIQRKVGDKWEAWNGLPKVREPKRVPLTWNTHTPFNTFEGFEVEYEGHEPVESTDHSWYTRETPNRWDLKF